MNVVFHIHDEKMWTTCLANVKNYLNLCEDKDSVKLEVVANGPAVKGYLNQTICQSIKEIIAEKSVVFSSCQKAMTNQGISEHDFLLEVSIVKSGVYRLVELQTQQYAYIKV